LADDGRKLGIELATLFAARGPPPHC
jgi:hypothetical protein